MKPTRKEQKSMMVILFYTNNCLASSISLYGRPCGEPMGCLHCGIYKGATSGGKKAKITPKEQSNNTLRWDARHQKYS